MSVDTEGDPGLSFQHLEDGQRERNQKRGAEEMASEAERNPKECGVLEQGVALNNR